MRKDRKILEKELKEGDRNTLTSLIKLLEEAIEECREKNDTAQERDILLNQGELKGYKKLLNCIKNT